jgi:hypothetical protein
VRHTFAPAGTAISITFDQPLLTSSIDSSSLRVFGRSTGTATGAVAFSTRRVGYVARKSGLCCRHLLDGFVDPSAPFRCILERPDSFACGPEHLQRQRAANREDTI